MICPLHGPVWRKDIAWFLDKYIHWSDLYPGGRRASSSPTPPSTAARKTRRTCWPRSWRDLGVRNVQMYDVSVTHSIRISSPNAFRCQPSGLCLHDLQRRDLRDDGESAARYRRVTISRTAPSPSSKTAPGPRPAAGLMRAESPEAARTCTILDETADDQIVAQGIPAGATSRRMAQAICRFHAEARHRQSTRPTRTVEQERVLLRSPTACLS